MNNKGIHFDYIGIIHTPHTSPQGTPIQPPAAKEFSGTVEIFPDYAEALQGLKGFSHIYLFYHFHLARRGDLTAKPFMDGSARGVFSMRGPSRPNPLGMSIVRLESISGNILHIRDVDILEGTPLLDIKPYVPGFDLRPDATSGWLSEKMEGLGNARDDGRFQKSGRHEE